MSDVAALLEERRGYVARKLADRVAQVDAQLAELGVATDGSEPDSADEVAVDANPDLEQRPATPPRSRKKPSRS